MASTATEDVTIAGGGGAVTVDVDVEVSDDVRVDVDANAIANADGTETPANNISPTSSSSNSGDDNTASKLNPHSAKSNKSNSKSNKYYVAEQPKDENLPNNIKDDPRGEDPTKRITKKASSRGAGRNTESFDPASTLVRPAMRVVVGNPNIETFNKTLKHDDVVIVPELFGPEDNWDLYYQLVSEITELQNSQVKNSDFIPWHEGAHLICKNPEKSTTFQRIISKLCDYFNIDASSAGTRFNWYKDSSDWKPFHHDSAAFNPKRAKSQNITVGVSFGATRELAFIRASDNNNSNNKYQGQGQQGQQDPVRLYFPQTNNGVFTFGRDVNILWKHGVNALVPEEQDGKGRISIILWGLARDVVEEEGSPPLLGSDGQGPHASSSNNNHHRNNHRRVGGRGSGGHGGGHARRKNGGGSGGGGNGNGRRDSSGSNKKRRFEDNDNDYYSRRGDDYDRRGGDDCYRYDDRDRSRGRDGGREQRRDHYRDNNNSHQRHRHDDDHHRGGGSGGGGHHNHNRHNR